MDEEAERRAARDQRRARRRCRVPRSNAITANAAAEIAHTPAASPSTPSEKLTAFIIADEAEQRQRRRRRSPSSTRPMNGSVTIVHRRRRRARGSARRRPGRRASTPRGSSRQSSIAPTTVISAAPPRIPCQRSASSAGTAAPPRARRRRSPGRRAAASPRARARGRLTAVDGADATREPRDERRQQRRHGEGDQEAEQRVVLHGAREDRRRPGARRTGAPIRARRRGGAQVRVERVAVGDRVTRSASSALRVLEARAAAPWR